MWSPRGRANQRSNLIPPNQQATASVIQSNVLNRN
jgi:hypothetical protein